MAQRNEKIDFYKSLLILGVVWGHTFTALRSGEGSGIYLITFFRTYDMPFFMFLSGYFLSFSLKKRNPSEVVINRITTLLIPLVIWEILMCILAVFVGESKNFFSLWFLWSCFICTLVTLFSEMLFKNKQIQALFLLAVIISLHLIPDVPFALGYMFPFFLIGYSYNYLIKKLAIIKAETMTIAAFILFLVMNCYWSGEYNVWNSGTYICEAPSRIIPIVLFRIAIGICGCLTMKCFFDILYEHINCKVKQFAVFVGKNTMIIYIVQALLVERFLPRVISFSINKIGSNPLVYNINLLGYVISPIIAIIAIAMIMVGVQITRKIPCISKILLGWNIQFKKSED